MKRKNGMSECCVLCAKKKSTKKLLRYDSFNKPASLQICSHLLLLILSICLDVSFSFHLSYPLGYTLTHTNRVMLCTHATFFFKCLSFFTLYCFSFFPPLGFAYLLSPSLSCFTGMFNSFITTIAPFPSLHKSFKRQRKTHLHKHTTVHQCSRIHHLSFR